MFNKLKEFPIIFYSLFVIIWGIYKLKYYNNKIFIFLIVLFFIIMFLNNILIATTAKKVLKYIVNNTEHFEIIFIVLMMLYLIAVIIINILISFRIFDENALFPMEAFSFILLGCSISGYNCYIYTKELRKK